MKRSSRPTGAGVANYLKPRAPQAFLQIPTDSLQSFTCADATFVKDKGLIHWEQSSSPPLPHEIESFRTNGSLRQEVANGEHTWYRSTRFDHVCLSESGRDQCEAIPRGSFNPLSCPHLFGPKSGSTSTALSPGFPNQSASLGKTQSSDRDDSRGNQVCARTYPSHPKPVHPSRRRYLCTNHRSYHAGQ